jgi:hypothetical protein
VRLNPTAIITGGQILWKIVVIATKRYHANATALFLKNKYCARY